MNPSFRWAAVFSICFSAVSFSNISNAAEDCEIPNDTFCVEYYANSDLSGNPAFTEFETEINHDWS